MGARKYLNITTSPVSIPCTGTAAVTGFRIFEADGTTPVSNYTPWSDASTKNVVDGDDLTVADQAIYAFLGVAGSAVDGQLSDAKLAEMLDGATGLDGTEVIKFCLANKSVTTNVGTLDVSVVGGDWENAVTF